MVVRSPGLAGLTGEAPLGASGFSSGLPPGTGAAVSLGRT